jgi:hypothetical protein
MLDLTSEQIGQTTHTRQDSATSRPTRLRGATEEQILAFFLKFTLEERVARFGAATSDDAIRAWRDGLDRSHYVAVSLEQGHQVVGLVELFGSRGTGWQRPELALSIHGVQDKYKIRHHLLEIGLGAARGRGSRDVCLAFNSAESCMVGIARQCGGTLDHKAGMAVIPCGFVLMDGVSAWRAVA